MSEMRTHRKLNFRNMQTFKTPFPKHDNTKRSHKYLKLTHDVSRIYKLQQYCRRMIFKHHTQTRKFEIVCILDMVICYYLKVPNTIL